jgi:hypothetical protein
MMDDESQPEGAPPQGVHASDPSSDPAPDGAAERLRFAKLEGRVRALEARFEDVIGAERNRKQRALYVRLVLLALLLGGFFLLRMRGWG